MEDFCFTSNPLPQDVLVTDKHSASTKTGSCNSGIGNQGYPTQSSPTHSWNSQSSPGRDQSSAVYSQSSPLYSPTGHLQTMSRAPDTCSEMQFQASVVHSPAVDAAFAPPVLDGSSGGAVELSDEIDKIAAEGIEESASNEVFSLYENKEIIPGCKPHPGEMVEAGSLSSLSLPEAVYPLVESTPSNVVKEGKLSSLQLEGILYACQRHQMILPNGSRAGFFLGDAAGVGKGRQIAGIIVDNYVRGRTRHIWFSISSDLIVDARRDFSDLDLYIKVIEGAQQLDKETRVLGLPGDFKEGVIFCTYASLISSVNKTGGKQSRLDQLIDWCGGQDFSGCLIFDECHKAKNFIPGKEQASTKVALAVTKIQRMLPKARVVYCSATGVSDVKNMAFMERLGLWGNGAAFKSFEQFLDTLHRKGLGVTELLALEMKTSGMYVARSLSFRTAEFVTEPISLTDDQLNMYDKAAHVWNELRKSLETAVHRTGSNNNRVWSSFWAAHQRFFRQLCMGIKVPYIISEVRKALEQGYCVVIGLQTTGEAGLENQMTRSKQVTNFVSLCREILMVFIETHFPTKIESQESESASKEDDWSVRAKEMLLGFAEQIDLPNSTLDELIDGLGGPDHVAEMTGRRGRIVRQSAKAPPTYELRVCGNGNTESLNVRERNMFMEGKKLVAVISDAASTGISLHASLKVSNQRRRIHMTIELPWSADKAVQQLGRTHRSNQTSGPIYRLLTTDLGGEMRFMAAVAKRLQSLGAISKGDRRAATGVNLEEFNLDTSYGHSALRIMYNSICQKKLAPGVSLENITQGKFDFVTFNTMMMNCLILMGIFERDSFTSAVRVKDSLSTDVEKFLNRIFGVSVSKQHLLFNYFIKCLESLIATAKRDNRYNEGLVDIIASSVRLLAEPKEVFKAQNKANNPTKHLILEVDRGMSWQQAYRRYKNSQREENGFYCSRRQHHGIHLYLLATLKAGSNHVYTIARPNTGVSRFEEDKTDLIRKYMPISPDKAEAGWTKQYERSKNRCIHGPNCRTGAGSQVCTVGSRCYTIHLLSGSIVTIMSLLESTIAIYGPRLNLSKSDSTLHVVRAKLCSGSRVVGIRYPEQLISLVDKQLEHETKIRNMTSQTLASSSHVTKDVSGVSFLEPVTPVMTKLQHRVLTEPPTLNTFFKTKHLRHSRHSDVTTNSEPESKITSSACSSSELREGTGLASGRLPESRKRCISGSRKPCNSNKKVCRQTSILLFAKTTQECPLVGGSPQSRDVGRIASCPICGEQFPATALNVNINEHIDQCLID